MSAGDMQRALDGALDAEMNAIDNDVFHAAQVARQALTSATRVDLFCPRHLATHRFDARQIEQLIYAQVASYADTMMDAVQDQLMDRGDVAGMSVDEVEDAELHDWCPDDWLRTHLDGELYSEHVESWVGSRREHDEYDPSKPLVRT